MCQPATLRFKWELEVSLTRMKKLNVDDIVLLFARKDPNIPKYFSKKYGVETHVYTDNRNDRTYIPSIKPYLWSQYLKEDRSRENHDYFYLDSDVIFREFPSVLPNANTWYGSDCRSYLGVEYLLSKGEGIFNQMCKIIGVDPSFIRSINPACGAQWVISKPTYEYWNKVYEDSIKIYRYLNSRTYSDIQKWTAEMWAQLYNVYYFGLNAEVSKELDFCWSTDDVGRYDETKILHNAGVTEKNNDLFFKGNYILKTPFEDDLSYVDPNKANIKYVEAIKEVKI